MNEYWEYFKSANGVYIDSDKDYYRDVRYIEFLLHFLEKQNDVLEVNLHIWRLFVFDL